MLKSIFRKKRFYERYIILIDQAETGFSVKALEFIDMVALTCKSSPLEGRSVLKGIDVIAPFALAGRRDRSNTTVLAKGLQSIGIKGEKAKREIVFSRI